MERTNTWNNLGTLATQNDFDTLLEESGLNYTAVAEDLFTEVEGTKIQIPGRKVIMREDNQEVFGIVSDRYQICQNSDALEFVKYIDGVKLERAGSYGATAWMIGALPEVKVLGDTITPHLIFQNSHDGSCSIKTTICMLRIVCQNQFVHSFKESPATISIRHYGNLEEKLVAARETMAGVYDYIAHYDQFANELAAKKVTLKKFNEIVEGYFKIPEECSPRTQSFILDRRERFIQAYNADDNQNFKGTKWGLINAFSDLITHEDYARKVNNWEANRFMNSLSPRGTLSDFISLVAA